MIVILLDDVGFGQTSTFGGLIPTPNLDALAAEGDIDNGTDPTKVSRNFQLRFEALDLQNGFSNQTLFLRVTQPLGEAQKSSLDFKVPLISRDVLGEPGLGIGDLILKFSHLTTLTPKYGILLTLEAAFDTADTADRGFGSNVLQPGITYARFLPGESLFALTLQHALTVGQVDPGRTEVNLTVMDFYYVPKLNDPRN